MIVDFDDFHQTNNRLDLLFQLKAANPQFRCTLYAVPGRGTLSFWNSMPDWIELAVHGYMHPDSYECSGWTAERMQQAIDEKPNRFVNGFKAPGWQISDGCYEALLDNGWWVADQPYNDHRRPIDLPVHRLGDHDHWHGHIQNVCGNGLEETFDAVYVMVRNNDVYEFASEAVGVLAA